MSYENAIRMSHHVAAGDFVGGANVDVPNLVGPPGLTGRVVAIAALLTTGVTVTASKIQVGSAADPDGYAYQDVPIQAVDTAVTGPVVDGALGNRIPADTEFEIGNAGGSTAGVAAYTVFIDWS